MVELADSLDSGSSAGYRRGGSSPPSRTTTNQRGVKRPMKTFIVAIPFFDSDMSVSAYRLNSRSGQKLLGMLVDEMSMSDAVLTT